MVTKIKTSVTLDKDLLNWVEEMVKLKRFATTTHAVEYALQRLKENERQELHLAVFDERLDILIQDKIAKGSKSTAGK